MRLSSRYQPTCLNELVGQPAVVRRLKNLVANPYPCCILLEGRGGIGKSSIAKALTADLGVSEMGLYAYSASKLRIEDVQHLFDHTFRYKPMIGCPWNILLIEEMELTVSKKRQFRIEKSTLRTESPGASNCDCHKQRCK